jgi:hypothetical protein
VGAFGFAAESTAHDAGFSVDDAGSGFGLVKAADDGVAPLAAAAAAVEIVIAASSIEGGMIAAIIGGDVVLAVDAVADFGRAAVAARGPGKRTDGQQSKRNRC